MHCDQYCNSKRLTQDSLCPNKLIEQLLFSASRLNDFSIVVGDHFSPDSTPDFSTYRSCILVSTAQGPVEKTYDCNTIVTGRYLAIYMQRKEYLLLCEVEVYGLKGEQNICKDWECCLYCQVQEGCIFKYAVRFTYKLEIK